jgi:redox-sensitive bicupin YhaK (pirin superfamily)
MSKEINTARPIVKKTSGTPRGAITRMMSPNLVEMLKPFVFLDLFKADISAFKNLPLHPHSGIGTITVVTEGKMRFDDPVSGTGIIGYRGVERMRAGSGVAEKWS